MNPSSNFQLPNESFVSKDCEHMLTSFYKKFNHNQSTIVELFENNPDRVNNYSVTGLNCHLDYSKNWLDCQTKNQLFKIADQAKLADKINFLFSGVGSSCNNKKAALHTALRDLRNYKNNIFIDNVNISNLVKHTQQQILQICTKLASKKLLGFSGKPIDTIINIGIGGSDLGPQMAYYALKPYWNKDVTCHFVSNLDPANINLVLSKLNPETCLFIVASKSFTTAETLANANVAKQWMLNYCHQEQLSQHFIAVTTSVEKAINFGLDPQNILPMWEWVGGRFSLWSAVGLIIALGTSYEIYSDLLNGAHALDQHFKNKPWSENIPVLLALIGIGYINFAKLTTQAILPYHYNLNYFVKYIQQLDMESNGKRVNFDDQVINYNTGPVIFGGIGTNSQHTFHQLLHQGNHTIPCDFIVPLSSDYQPDMQQQALVANAFAQARTLLEGSPDQANSLALNCKQLPGNKPSNMLLVPKLTPYYLGILIALYEHKIFTQGVIWQIDSFDQWGVEYGKIVANEILKNLGYNKLNVGSFDASTQSLITKYQEIISHVQ